MKLGGETVGVILGIEGENGGMYFIAYMYKILRSEEKHKIYYSNGTHILFLMLKGNSLYYHEIFCLL